jgi:hypothetical protein
MQLIACATKNTIFNMKMSSEAKKDTPKFLPQLAKNSLFVYEDYSSKPVQKFAVKIKAAIIKIAYTLYK